MGNKFLALLTIVLFLTSCKNEKNNTLQQSTNLPNYANIDLKNVFTPQENQVQNQNYVKTSISNYWDKIWNKGELSGGLLVAKGDHIIAEEYRGFAQPDAQQPIDKNTALHVASVSKTLTSMAVLKLVEAGKVKLTDPLTKYFPHFPYQNIHVLELLNHRSGLPKYEHFIDHLTPKPAELDKKYLTNQDVLNLLIKYKPELARETNTGFMYCNTNFALLALIVEKVTKTPFPRAMEEMIFQPLQMKNTYVFQEKDTLSAAKSFYNKGTRLYPYDRLDLIYGDKNVYTTTRDLHNFSKALFSKDFLNSQLKEMIFTPYSNEKNGVNNYGLGFRMKIFDNGEKLVYHNGWWHGSNAVFAHLLKSKVTIIAIGNRYSGKVYSALSLSSLFEDFPVEAEKFYKTMHPKDSSQADSADSGD